MSMKVACCQIDIAWEDKAVNHARVASLLEGAGLARGCLVLLPEMFATGFSMNVAGIDDTETCETRDFLSGVALKHGVYLVGGLVTRGGDGLGQNVAAVFGPDGREVARYQKIHPFTLGGESRYYAEGSGVVRFSWGGFTVVPFICYDLRFPEVFRVGVCGGANLFVVIANWPAAREQHWLTLLQARAIENQAYVAAVNRVGRDNTLAYSGRSVVIDPRGRILADAGGAEGVIGATLELELLQAYRGGFPALGDMRFEPSPRPTPLRDQA